jgi:hypothetical protein
MTIDPRALRRIAARCALLVVLIAGAAWLVDGPAPAAPTSTTCETP